MPSSQARNQEFFRAGEFSSNQGTLINIPPTTRERKVTKGKNLSVFHLKPLKNFTLNEKFYPQMNTIRAFFLEIRVLFSSFRKSAGESFPLPICSYALGPWKQFFHLLFRRSFPFPLTFPNEGCSCAAQLHHVRKWSVRFVQEVVKYTWKRHY